MSQNVTFEVKIAEYVDKTDNYVLYRVIPVFVGDNLVVGVVHIETWSVEYNEKGICYNVKQGIEIDYKIGDCCRSEESDM